MTTIHGEAYNESDYNLLEGTNLAKDNTPNPVSQERTQGIDVIIKRLDMLDDRLDNIDSVVSAVVERVMKQPVTFNLTCSKCGQNIEIALMGTEKPKR